MQEQEDKVVQGIAVQLTMYVDAIRKLTTILDQENTLLMFEENETQVLRNALRQELKQTLYKRVDNLARIVTRTLEVGTHEEIRLINRELKPLDNFRRSLRLNTVLLEMTMERQQRRMQRIIEAIDGRVPHVAERSL